MLNRGILGVALAIALSGPAGAEYTFRPNGSGIGSVSGIVKGDGAGNPSQAIAGTDYVVPSALSAYQTVTANLTALLGMGNGCAAHTASTTWIARTISGTANEITATNGNCIGGNPTLSLPAALTFTGKTVTGGSFNVDHINGPVGDSAPNTGVFTTGSASNRFILTTNGAGSGLYFNDAATASALYINSGLNLNFSPDNPQLIFRYSGTEIARLTSGGSAQLRGLAGVADIREWGTVTCNGSSSSGVDTAIAAAAAAGYTRFFLPANCWWINPGGSPSGTTVNSVPTGYTIIGENSSTSVIANKDWNGAPPASAPNDLQFEAYSGAQNVGIISGFCYGLTDGTHAAAKRICPISEYYNRGGSINGPANYPFQHLVINLNPVTTPGFTPATFNDIPGIAVNNSAIGDGIFISNNGIGGTGALKNGSGLNINDYTTGDPADTIGAINIIREANGGHLITMSDAGSGSYTTSWVNMVSHHQTTGSFWNVYHDTSTFSDGVLQMNMAVGSGTFTGKFAIFSVNSVEKFSIDSGGVLKVAGSTGVSCAGGTVVAATVVVVGGIVTHC